MILSENRTPLFGVMRGEAETNASRPFEAKDFVPHGR
jgi:hypothetical protein